MIYESLVVLVWFALMTLIGVGPALTLLPRSEKQFVYACGIAPALGFALVGIAGFPMVRHVAPVNVWAFPFAGLLVASSLALLVLWWRNVARAVALGAQARALIVPILIFLICYLLLVSPLAVKGIEYALFRSNPSDAFVYMSLGETTRVADWATIERGAEFTQNNWRGITELAGVSPTSLFSARFIGLSFSLNNPILLAWFASLAQIPIYHVFYAYNLLALACALPLTLVIGKHLRLPRWLNYFGGAVIVLGFWARYILETDASGEIASLPLLMLTVFAWIEIEANAARVTRGNALLFGLGFAAAFCFNFPILALLLGGMGLYYLTALVRRQTTFQKLFGLAIPFALAIVILFFTGQLDYIAGNTVRGLNSVSGQAAFSDYVISMLEQDQLSALWGMPRDLLWGDLPLRLQQVFLRPLALLLGFLMTGLALTTVWFARQGEQNSADRIMGAIVSAGLLLFGYFFWRSNDHAAGKVLTYAFPYLFWTALLGYKYVPPGPRAAVRWGITLLLAVWLCVQVLMSVYLPYSLPVRDIFRAGNRFKNEALNAQPLLTTLDHVKPARLLVDVPRDEDWMFAYYVMFIFAKYRPYFQSGVIVDNNVTFQNLWFTEMDAAPDYAVILKKVDYIGPMQLGQPMAVTQDLILYRVTNQDVSLWRTQEKVLQQREADKPLFTTLQ